jgi:hypothetical protein
MVGGEWMSAYTSEECWVVGLVSWPTNENIRTDGRPYHNITEKRNMKKIVTNSYAESHIHNKNGIYKVKAGLVSQQGENK